MALPPLTPNAWLRWDVVERALPAQVTTVLEIGCGQGGFGARLSQGRDYLGVEPTLGAKLGEKQDGHQLRSN